MPKQIQIDSARDIIASFAPEKTEVEWPQRCATSQILLRNDAGKIIETDMFVSANVTEDGKFDTDAQNPLVIHNAPDGQPQHQYVRVMVKQQNRETWPWIAQQFGAFVAGFMDKRVPSLEEEPESAESLSKPDAVPT